jgi:hypothetical protein
VLLLGLADTGPVGDEGGHGSGLAMTMASVIGSPSLPG